MSQDRAALLAKAQLLEFFPPEARERIAACFKEERHAFGDIIVREGDPGEAYYILVEGRARVYKTSSGGEEMPLNVLRAGDEFGEMALLEEGKRTASVRCSSETVLLRLDRQDFHRLLAEEPELRRFQQLRIRHRQVHNFLREAASFGDLPAATLQAFLEQLTPMSFAQGEVIIREGDPTRDFYIVEKGRARVYVNGNGARRTIGYCRAGDHFGEISALRGTPRTATVETVTDCRLLCVRGEALRELVEAHPAFKDAVERRIASYQFKDEARVPLDFAQEMLPADAASKVEIDARDDESRKEVTDADRKKHRFISAEGHFKKKPRRSWGFPHVRQIDEMDCGAAALAMVCRHFGKRVSLPRIRQLAHTALDGTSLRSLVGAASELGLAARAVKSNPDQLDQIPLPAIVHWEGHHWIVLYDVGKRHVRIADPATGLSRISRAEFAEKWSGYAALFDYTKRFEQAPVSKQTWGWALTYLKPFRVTLFQVLTLAVVTSGLQLLLPVFTQVIVDRVVIDNDVATLNVMVGAMLVALVFMLTGNILQRFMLSFAAVHIDAAILDHLTRSMLALPMSYFNSRRTGDIQRRLAGAQQVREFIVHGGLNGLLSMVQITAYLALMAVYSMTLFAVFVATVPLYAGLMVFSRRVLRPLFNRLEENYGRYQSHQIDSIRGIEAVKASAAEQHFRDRMLNEFLSLSMTHFKSKFTILLYESMIQAVGYLSTVLFLLVGAHRVMQGEMTIGGFVAFNALVAMAYTPILNVLGLWDEFQMSSVLMDRLNDIFEFEPEQGRDRSHLQPVRTLEGRVDFNGVSFRYGGPGSALILDNVSIAFPAGKTTAIVGRSGCGKTTLIKLLSGLLEPSEGKILFDGVEMNTLNYRDLRRQIGLVLQESYLFDGSILENISFGDPDPDLHRAAWAAQVASAHDFTTRLPMGYETRVGETGISLSGGQRQRIAIARALYENPPIIVFDEATSALDSESERAIQDNLSNILSNRTAVVIAHRLSTIRNADNIVVLEKGAVAETGTHDELMARKGLYFYLCSQQLGL